MPETQEQGAAKALKPPYIAFQTIKTVAKDMKANSVPSRIDRSVFPNLAGGVVGQLLPALKFLGLTDDDGKPTDNLHEVVAAVDDEKAWPPALASVVKAAYAPLFQINLETASPNQFSEHFRKTYPGAEDVSRKSQTFFLNAAREAGLKVSSYIMKNKKPRTTPAKKRSKTNGNKNADTPDLRDDPPPPPAAAKLPSEVLLALFDAQMKDAEKNAIWTLIQYFKAKGK